MNSPEIRRAPHAVNMRHHAVVALARSGEEQTPRGTSILINAITDEEECVSSAAAAALGAATPGMRAETFSVLLNAVLTRKAPALRDAALMTMIESYPEETSAALPQLLSRFESDVTLAKAALAAAAVGSPDECLRIAEAYMARVKDKPEQALAFLFTIPELHRRGRLEPARHAAAVWRILVEALRSNNPELQRGALAIFAYSWYGALGGNDGVQPSIPAEFTAALNACRESPDPEVAKASSDLLARLGIS